jgi:superfamily II DNA or RNA helicase
MNIEHNITEILEDYKKNEENNLEESLLLKKIKKPNNKKNKKIEKEPIPVQLYPHQIKHKDKLNAILELNPFALDFSMLGTGKTYTSSEIFTSGNYKHLVIIAPVSVKTKWKYMEKEHGIIAHKSVSFCELRSIKFKQPKHELLIRKDYMAKVTQKDGTIREMEKTSFACTSKYLDLVNEGLLLVIDEIQNIKNVSDQLSACKELIRPISNAFDFNGKSRILLLSGSPIDKKVQVIHLFKTLNIMNENRLCVFNPQTYRMMWRGMQEIEDYCRNTFGQGEIDRVKNTFPYVNEYSRLIFDRDLEEYCYRLFQLLLKKHVTNTMLPTDQTTIITKQNAFYDMNDEMKELLKKGIKMLKSGTRFNAQNGTIDHGHNGIAALKKIQRALTMIETSKINTMIRVAKNNVEQGNKVVICVNYTASVEDLLAGLKDFNPLRLDGSMSAKKRLDILTKFQKGDNEFRVLIGNLTVCSTGIDLDDQHGKFPRICLVSPNYNTISLYQLSHRFQRANTKSDSTIHFVFGNVQDTELPILNALAKKSNIMKEITREQADHGIVFPGDYEPWNESSPP